jgi:uncharacterized protein YcbK (DUF882 family)
MKHFKPSDFASPDDPDTGQLMNEMLLSIVDQLQDRLQFPLKINSGFRTKEHNEKVGGSANSAHLRGYAVDIAAKSGREKYYIVREALRLGINRIGIGKTYVHLDIDPLLPQNVVWTY